MKIIKHARDSHHQLPPPATGPNPTASFSPAVGQLLGIDAAGTLEVSNAFPLPAGAFDNSDSESKGVKAGKLQPTVLRQDKHDLAVRLSVQLLTMLC